MSGNINWSIKEVSEIKPLAAYIERILPKAKKGVNVTVNQNRPLRSSKQRRYYFGVIISIIAEESGYKKTEHDLVHEWVKDKFCPAKDTPLGLIKSTKLLNTVEEEEYHKDIRDWYEDFTKNPETGIGVIIPLPNETENWNY